MFRTENEKITFWTIQYMIVEFCRRNSSLTSSDGSTLVSNAEYHLISMA